MRVLFRVVLLGCGLAASAWAQQPGPAVPVGTVPAARKPVTKQADFVGRVSAIEHVEVHARITGYLDEVLFKDGDSVKEGQPLYRIEKDLFQAAVEQAEGTLAGDKAKKLLTAVQYQRAAELAQTASGAGTLVARDQALTADRAADAQILISKANLDSANINLRYTEINSPIAGKISRTKVTKGNVVSPESGALTTIVSQDPIYVLFPVSQRQIMDFKRRNAVEVDGIKVGLKFPDGSTYDQIGRINFIDVTVDRATDTLQIRAIFPNPASILRDGQLANVELKAGKSEDEIVVPQEALLSDQQGVYVFVVEDGKAVARHIKPGGASGADTIVSEGLSEGEQVIVEGLQALRPGASVRAKPATPILK